MKEIAKIAALLRSDAMEKQVAAAIVLGEIGQSPPPVLAGLTHMLESGVAPLQRHALDALSKLGAARFSAKVLSLLAARDEEVRMAAVRAALSLGQAIVPKLRARMSAAGSLERRAIESVLTQLGGGEAFSAVLDGLHALDEEGAKAVAAQVRAQLKEADAKTRKNYFAQLNRFVKAKKTQGSPVALATALRLVGAFEDAAALAILLAHASNSKAPAMARLEAIAGLRAAKGDAKLSARAGAALLKLAEGDDTTLARAALLTLGGLTLPAALAGRFAALAGHSDAERARFAITELGRQDTAQAIKGLVEVVTTQDRVRAELAANALKGRRQAAPELVRALLATQDAARAQVIRRALRMAGGELDAKLRQELARAMLSRLLAGKPGWEAALETMREIDPQGAASSLRDATDKLLKARKRAQAMQVARVLSQSERATPEDRFRLAALELAQGRHDTHPMARSRDPALRTLVRLSADGFDVAAALRKERGLDLEAKFYVGFHFVEERHPLGEELLSEVAKAAGRSKLGQMAKNKLELAARQE